MSELHPWRRYVAIGDSFTEGVGDPEPSSPGGHRGWSDRVAEVLAASPDDFAYANLAIRGRLLQQIIDEQVEQAVALKPDLVSANGGGNDILRPGGDPDDIAARFEGMVERLGSTGATVVIFAGMDVGWAPVFSRLRGRVAVLNEHLRAIAARHDCVVVDLWAMRELQDTRMWDVDRLHLAPLGHHTVARAMLAALHVENELEPRQPDALPVGTWRQARAEDLVWAREYFVPWVLRRVRNQSSGDGRTAKRPEAGPYAS
ncbi:SGNH/GDSL hydrolase family protein [Planctomonas psychrotolerans]|uniref:SGNH/GDSL hydrolase family protein n=1 Tax=Planctomonas psychrotolerans TaxID=2528712 RepID=UPI00123A7BB3|nr:SGNH/GDSL hydrolase family protein [Planctomonas psychrotolerans]